MATAGRVGHPLQINVVYDGSTASAPSGFFTAVNAAVQYWEQELTNPITVTIHFGWGEANGAAITGSSVGESQSAGLNFSYAVVQQALANAALSPDDVESVGSLPAIDPTGNRGLFVSLAEAAALGLPTGGGQVAGYVGLNASDSYNFDPANRSGGGNFDAIGALEHEISEVLGRLAFSGEVMNGSSTYAPLDLFRYTGPGALASFPAAANLSIDGGSDLQLPFNAPSSGDAGDWSQFVQGDSFGGATPGLELTISATDLQVMDILGYTLAHPTRPYSSGVTDLQNVTSWVYDDLRGLYYFATARGVVEAYNPANGSASLVANLGQAIRGLSITPDGGSLYVADYAAAQIPSGGATETLDRIDLNTRAVSVQTFTGGTFDAGAASVAISQDGVGYFTTAINGTGQAEVWTFSPSGAFAPRLLTGFVDLASGSDNDREHNLTPALSLSEDGRYLAIGSTATSPGSLYLMDAQTGALLAHSDYNSGKMDVNAAAGLIVEAGYTSLVVADLSLHQVKDLTSITGFVPDFVIGAHFSQDGKELYLWDRPDGELLVYDTSSWQQVGTIALSSTVTTDAPRDAGAMSLSDNGRLLLLDTGSGFEIVNLRPGDHREDFHADGQSDFLIENAAGAAVVGEVMGGQAKLSLIGGLGPEWTFVGDGDFLGDGKSDFLIENTASSVVVGEVVNGQAALTLVGGLGPEWRFVGTADFLGDGKSDFLIENTAGSVVVGEVVNGQAALTLVGGLGPEWKFVGAGDFLGDGKSDFLIENTAGSVVVGEVVNGQAALTLVGGLGPEWKFVGTGDFLGDGKDDWLMENTAGAVVVGKVVNGQAAYTQVAGLGPEWKFVGTGDYFGEGHDQFLIENTAGAVIVGDWTGGQLHLTQVSGLGSEWTFH
jgi:hypothetical protein